MLGELESALNLFGHPRFMAGVLAGGIGLVLIVLSTFVLRRRIFGWGIVFAAAAILVLYDRSSTAPLWRLVFLAAAGLTVDIVWSTAGLSQNKVVRLTPWVVVAAAAWWVFGDITGPTWIRVVLPLATLVLGFGVWRLERLPEADLIGPMVAMSVAGAWVTIPETDQFVVMLGVALPMALATLRPIGARVLAAGGVAVVSTFAWLAYSGGSTRPWTFTAALFLLASVPVMALVLQRRSSRPSRLLLLVIQLVYVILVTRVADYTQSIAVVVLWATAAMAAMGVVAHFIPAVSDRSPAAAIH